MDNNPLSKKEKENITSDSNRQDEAHLAGAYDYLLSLHMVPRYGIIASYSNALKIKNVLDIGCGNGVLRNYLPQEIRYYGVDISLSAIETALRNNIKSQNTNFECVNFMTWDIMPQEFDCIIWAGIGVGFANQIDFDIIHWKSVINRIVKISTQNFVLMLECISDYKVYIDSLSAEFDLISLCELNCLSSGKYPIRYFCILKYNKSKNLVYA